MSVLETRPLVPVLPLTWQFDNCASVSLSRRWKRRIVALVFASHICMNLMKWYMKSVLDYGKLKYFRLLQVNNLKSTLKNIFKHYFEHFKKDITWCEPFLKSLLNLLQYCPFHVLVSWPRGMWISPTRDWTHTPCIGRQSLNHWTTREVPILSTCKHYIQKNPLSKNFPTYNTLVKYCVSVAPLEVRFKNMKESSIWSGECRTLFPGSLISQTAQYLTYSFPKILCSISKSILISFYLRK